MTLDISLIVAVAPCSFVSLGDIAWRRVLGIVAFAPSGFGVPELKGVEVVIVNPEAIEAVRTLILLAIGALCLLLVAENLSDEGRQK